MGKSWRTESCPASLAYLTQDDRGFPPELLVDCSVDKPMFILVQYNVSSGTERLLLGSCQRAPQRQPDHLCAM